MLTKTEFQTLLAQEAAGTLAEADRARLQQACEADRQLSASRSRFLGIVQAAATDDTTDAPGPVLLRAHAIPRLVAERDAPVPLLRVVFDSLRPAVGLRSAGTANRQLLLETERVALDVFMEPQHGGRFRLRVMIEGEESEGVAVVGPWGSLAMDPADDGWVCTADGGPAVLEVTLSDMVLVSERFEIG